MHSRRILICFFLCLPVIAAAQDPDGHEHHRNEAGIGNSVVYFMKEGAFAYSLHAHYTRNIAGTAFETGLGFERIFSDPGHNVFLLELAYRPVEALSLGLSPGLLTEDGHPGVRFAFHLETSYEFEIGGFHLGPVMELAFDREDVHLSLGLHAGIAF